MVDQVKTDKKKIAKNTLLLYFRMFITMGVGLYTSRLVLQILGVEDYGTYNVVGGVVGMLGFLNAALSNGTSRFITYELGKGNFDSLNKTFQNAVIIHITLACLVLVIAETLGLWFFYNKAAIPVERMDAAIWAYHSSVLAAMISISQVPFISLIISHEKMSFYAYVAIIDVILKLLIVYLLMLSADWDKLVVYAYLIMFTQIIGFVITYVYCRLHFKESSISSLKLDIKLFKEILGFSSWSLIGNLTGVLNNQGMTIITNMFFGPVVVSARAISITVNSSILSFVNNFRTAANPQIIKLYAIGEKEKSKELLLSTTKFSFFLMLILAAPLICLTDELLHLWLVEVPDYTCVFVQLIIIQSTLFTFDTCFYTGLYACGKVRVNALISPIYYLVQFVMVYLLFSLGMSPVTLSIAGIITTLLVVITAKPFLLKKYAGFKLSEIYKLLFRCFFVALFSLPMPVIVYLYCGESVVLFFVKGFLCIIGVLPSILLLGLSKQERNDLKVFIQTRIRR